MAFGTKAESDSLFKVIKDRLRSSTTSAMHVMPESKTHQRAAIVDKACNGITPYFIRRDVVPAWSYEELLAEKGGRQSFADFPMPQQATEPGALGGTREEVIFANVVKQIRLIREQENVSIEAPISASPGVC